jgi:asparagine synthase (glutamine-hydrolysing)
MFYFKVEAKGRAETKNLINNSYTVVDGDAAIVSVSTDDLYSFYGVRYPNVFIGEALAPLTELDLKRLYKGVVLERDPQFADLRVASIAIINVATGRIRVMRSVSCNRPVYYHRGQGVFHCSSHLRPFKAEGVKFEFDDDLLPEFLVYRYVMPPKTLLRNISSIPGGCGLIIDIESGNTRNFNLWRVDRDPRDSSLEQAIESVSARLGHPLMIVKEKPHKATLLLSGGLDSSILGALCKKVNISVDSVSSGFHKITGDPGESDYARTAADLFGFNHKVYDIDEKDYLTSLIDCISFAEEPIHHLQSAVLGSMFARSIKPDTKYLVNGEGADSLFSSAVHLRHIKSKNIVRFTDTRLFKSLARPFLNSLAANSERIRYLLYDHSDDHSDDSHFLWTLEAFGDMDWVRDHFGKGLTPIVEGRRRFLGQFEDWPLLDRITILLFCSEVDETMRVWGKLAEEAGFIMIYPFSNPELISYLFSVDWNLKARDSKYLLKRLALKSGIPEQIINRPKRGFGFPARFWAPPGALFQPLVDMAAEMFDAALLKSLQVENGLRAMVLWGYLNIYLWHKIVIEGISTSNIKAEIASRRKALEKSRA